MLDDGGILQILAGTREFCVLQTCMSAALQYKFFI
jgi:hypothetical protein